MKGLVALAALLLLVGFSAIQIAPKEGRYGFEHRHMDSKLSGVITLKKAKNSSFVVGGQLAIGSETWVVSGNLTRTGRLAAKTTLVGSRREGEEIDGEWDAKTGGIRITRIGSQRYDILAASGAGPSAPLPAATATPGPYSGRNGEISIELFISPSNSSGQFAATGWLTPGKRKIQGTYFADPNRNEVRARAQHSDLRDEYYQITGPFKSGRFIVSVRHTSPTGGPEVGVQMELFPGKLTDPMEHAKLFTGKWDIGLKDNSTGTKPVIMTIQCNGQTLSGSYPLWYGGQVVGEVQADGTIKGQWTNTYKGGDGGEFTMALSADGSTWSGSWKGRFSEGTWKGRRVK